MTLSARLLLLLLASLCGLWSASPEKHFGAPTRYTIDLAESASGWLGVSVESDCPGSDCTLRIPAWSATYQIRDFSRFVSRLEAADAEGVALPVSRPAPNAWTIQAPDADRIRVSYLVRADRPGPFGAYADSGQVTLNLAQVLLYRDSPVDPTSTLRFTSVPAGFGRALALDEVAGVYSAPSYSRLVDTPAHLSPFQERSFSVDGKPVRVVAYGPEGRFNPDLLASTAERLFGAAWRLMGPPPFERYTLVYVFADEDGGGMEYRDGALIFGPADCASCGMAALTAHEIFHLWNVKRIRPASMEPVDFSRPNPSPSLWFAEGVTSAYARYLQRMGDLLSSEQLLAQFDGLVREYLARPARLSQSAEESGVEAWLERYPDYARADRSVSYYLRGELIGHLLDLTIRHRTDNRRSLDEVLRLLDERYGQTGLPYDDTDALEQAVAEIAGGPVADVFDELVRNADAVDWDRYLGYAGLRLERFVVERVDPGMTLTGPPGQGVLVAAVEAGGAAEEAGFRPGDRLLRIDRKRAVSGPLDAARRIERAAGRSIEAKVERAGVELKIDLVPPVVRSTEYKVTPDPLAGDQARQIRTGWLDRWTTPRP